MIDMHCYECGELARLIREDAPDRARYRVVCQCCGGCTKARVSEMWALTDWEKGRRDAPPPDLEEAR